MTADRQGVASASGRQSLGRAAHPRAAPHSATGSVMDRSSMFMWYVSRWITTLSSPMACRSSMPCVAGIRIGVRLHPQNAFGEQSEAEDGQ